MRIFWKTLARVDAWAHNHGLVAHGKWGERPSHMGSKWWTLPFGPLCDLLDLSYCAEELDLKGFQAIRAERLRRAQTLDPT